MFTITSIPNARAVATLAERTIREHDTYITVLDRCANRAYTRACDLFKAGNIWPEDLADALRNEAQTVARRDFNYLYALVLDTLADDIEAMEAL